MKEFVLRSRRQSGVTLMELMAVLLVIATVVVGALALFDSAESTHRSIQMIQEVTGLKHAVKGLYSGQPGFLGLSNDVLILSKRVPSTLLEGGVVGARTLTNAFAGSYSLAAVSSPPGSGTNNYFAITVDKVPTAVCTAVFSAPASGWTSVEVTTGGTGPKTDFPLAPATAASECGTTNANTVVFRGL